jgi:hypothetical protein
MKKRSILPVLGLLFALASHSSQAQDAPPAGAPQPYSNEPSAAAQPELMQTETPRPAMKSGDDDTSDISNFHMDWAAEHRHSLSPDYDALNEVTCSITGMIGKYDTIGLRLGGGAFQLPRGSFGDMIAHQPYVTELGVLWRHSFTAQKAFLQPYITVNFSALWMFWDYRQPQTTDSGFVTRDFLQGFGGYAGLGLSVRMHRRLSLFAELGVGDVGFYDSTFEGFKNTMFGNFGYAGVKGGLSVAF